MKSIITASTVSVKDAIQSIDGESIMGHIIQLADAAGYEMYVDDLYKIGVLAKPSEDSIWLPEIDVKSMIVGNSLKFYATCRFPHLDSDESYHIKHWMLEWSKVADFVNELTRFKIDLRSYM